MKKLLVILMLGAEFVTVALADSLDCTDPNNINPCCVDVVAMQTAIAQSKSHRIFSSNKYVVVGVDSTLINGGSACEDGATYINYYGQPTHGGFAWVPGKWYTSLFKYQ